MEEYRLSVLFEPDFKGHRAVFLGFILQHVRARGSAAVIAVSDDALESEEFAMNGIPALAENGGVFTLGRLPEDRGRTYRHWLLDQLRHVYDSFPSDQVYVLEGDIAAGLTLRIPPESLARTTFLLIRRPVVVGTTLRSTISSWRKAVLFSIASLRGASIVLLGASVAKGKNKRAGTWRIAPDAVVFHGNSELSARYAQKMDLDRARVWYGVFGNIDRRKNLDLIAGALAETANPERTGLLVAGRVTQSERRLCEPALTTLRGRGAKVVFDDRLLPAADLDAAIGAVDAAVFAQKGDSPSNIYGKARAAGIPVVCSGSRILKDPIRESRSGIWTPLRRRPMARAYESVIYLPHSGPSTMCGPDEFAEVLLGEGQT